MRAEPLNPPTPSKARVASQYLAARAFDLANYNLEGLLTGSPVTLYHGTTRQFKTFDLKYSRDDLVNDYYGRGIFLSPSKRVAEKYANANRNIGFDPSIIDDLARKNRNAANLMRALYKQGRDAWETFPAEIGVELGPTFHIELTTYLGGLDPNTIADITGYIIGSKVDTLETDSGPSLFSQSSGLPSYMYDNLDEIGLDSDIYRPKIYTVTVKVTNVLVTANATQAKKARSKGYDAVVFHGSHLVDNVPEVAVFDPHLVHIKSVEVA
jgi:hypothetical protein